MLISGFGLATYYFYRQNFTKEMALSHGYYRLMNHKNVNVNAQFYEQGAHNQPRSSFSWFYRIPKKEFDTIYRMKGAYVRGAFDHNKEILFPSTKNGISGYDVITPFYYHTKLFLDTANLYLNEKGDPVNTYTNERSAIAVN
jgi:hypothetical protein